jgi:hypothetical protein
MNPSSCKFLKVLLFTPLFFGCNSKNTQDLKLINPFQNTIPSLNTSQVIDTIKFIPLETNDNNMIGSVSKIIKYDDKYIIMDNKMAKKLYVFDKEGKFLYSIGRSGKGPGEYSRLMDFTVDEKEGCLYLIDDRIKIIKTKMDGTLIFEKKVPQEYNDIKDIIAHKGLIFVSSAYGISNQKKYHIVQLDKNLDPIAWFLPYEYGFPGSWPYKNRLFVFDNSINYVSTFDNVIYIRSGDEFIERYKFNTEGNNVSLKNLTMESFADNKTGVYLFDGCVEGDDFIYLPIFDSGKPRWGFIDKKSDNFFQVDEIKNDSYPLGSLSAYYNGWYICTMNSNNFIKNFPKNNLNREPTDNPIIIEYQISFKNL